MRAPDGTGQVPDPLFSIAGVDYGVDVGRSFAVYQPPHEGGAGSDLRVLVVGDPVRFEQLGAPGGFPPRFSITRAGLLPSGHNGHLRLEIEETRPDPGEVALFLGAVLEVVRLRLRLTRWVLDVTLGAASRATGEIVVTIVLPLPPLG